MKDLKHMQVSAALLPFLCFPSDVAPIVLSRAPRLLCVLDRSWHVTNGPGHLSAPLSCPLFPTALTTLLCRGALCGDPVTSAGALQQKVGGREGGSQAASAHRFVSATHTLMCSFHQMQTAAEEDANNHLKNKNIPLELVKDKLQFQ